MVYCFVRLSVFSQLLWLLMAVAFSVELSIIILSASFISSLPVRLILLAYIIDESLEALLQKPLSAIRELPTFTAFVIWNAGFAGGFCRAAPRLTLSWRRFSQCLAEVPDKGCEQEDAQDRANYINARQLPEAERNCRLQNEDSDLCHINEPCA